MTINLTAPTNWGELTVAQLRTVLETLSMQLTREEMLFVLFCELTGIRKNGDPTTDDTQQFLTEDGTSFTLTVDQIADFCSRFEWLTDTAPEGIANPTPKDDYLRDMSFGDYYEADVHFRLLEADDDLAHFDIILPKLGEKARPMADHEALMYRLWWGQVSGFLAELYPRVFAEKGDARAEANPFKTLQEIHLMLNDDHPQENDRIDNANLHDVLSAIQNKIEKAERIEEQMKRV